MLYSALYDDIWVLVDAQYVKKLAEIGWKIFEDGKELTPKEISKIKVATTTTMQAEGA